MIPYNERHLHRSHFLKKSRSIGLIMFYEQRFSEMLEDVLAHAQCCTIVHALEAPLQRFTPTQKLFNVSFVIAPSVA